MSIDNCHANTIYKGYGPQSITLTATLSGGTPPFSYLWSNGATTPTITVSPTTGTDYTVTVTDINDCPANASNTLHVSVIDIRCGNNKVNVVHSPGNSHGQVLCVPTGSIAGHISHGDCLGDGTNVSAKSTAPATYNNVGNGNISVFPNPASGKISIVLRDVGSIYKSYQVTDISGRVILTYPITDAIYAGILDLDISAYAPGTYIIRGVTDEGTSLCRFTVTK
jgi:hypothetical protein